MDRCFGFRTCRGCIPGRWISKHFHLPFAHYSTVYMRNRNKWKISVFPGAKLPPSLPPTRPKLELRCGLLTRRKVAMDVPQFIAGRFRIEREIGTGGMGTVYLATHLGSRTTRRSQDHQARICRRCRRCRSFSARSAHDGEAAPSTRGDDLRRRKSARWPSLHRDGVCRRRNTLASARA